MRRKSFPWCRAFSPPNIPTSKSWAGDPGFGPQIIDPRAECPIHSFWPRIPGMTPGFQPSVHSGAQFLWRCHRLGWGRAFGPRTNRDFGSRTNRVVGPFRTEHHRCGIIPALGNTQGFCPIMDHPRAASPTHPCAVSPFPWCRSVVTHPDPLPLYHRHLRHRAGPLDWGGLRPCDCGAAGN